jgi:hypothetical protein
VAAAAAAARTVQAPKRLASGSMPPGPVSPARDRDPRRGQRTRALGLHRAYHAGDVAAGSEMTPVTTSAQLRRRHVNAAEMPVYQALSSDDFR